MELKELKGIGAARLQVLNDAGINDILDLLYYFPRRYVDRTITDSTLLKAGQEITIMLTVQNQYLSYGKRPRLIIRCRSQNGEPVSLVFFKGVAFFKHQFDPGDLMIVSGKLEFFQGMQIIHPDFEKLDEDESSDLLHSGRIIPLYRGSELLKKNRIDSRAFRRFIHEALDDESGKYEDPLVPLLRKKYSLLSYEQTLQNIHFPKNNDMCKQARYSLIFEELYLFTLLLYTRSLQRKKLPRNVHPLEYSKSIEYQEMIKRLPFTLTNEQIESIKVILSDAAQPYCGAWLLQGDVGSGKTLVALAVALHYIEAGIQVVILAPTEVLARQHYQTISNFLGLAWHHRMELHLGRGRAKKKAEALDRMASADAMMIIGTHSLIEPAVAFANLGLVIIDEQHRFGVRQRESIRAKGNNPDLLAMTATPIPRSLCLTEYSDLKMVTLKKKPAGRKPIETMWLNESRRNGMYQSIRNHIADGRQGFIVYPLISESEKMDLQAAEEAFVQLQTAIFPDLKIALMHGRLKSDQKEKIMNDFRNGKLHLLVTTTVIEVGVDVPNATMMIIENAERFGISQLHQLRGRVGRGEEKSYCVLMSDADNEDAVERLQALVDSQDGFYLSEIDMKIRGPGELLGLKQHGLPGFRLADLVRDKKIVEKAYTAAREFHQPNKTAIKMIRRNFSDGLEIFPDT